MRLLLPMLGLVGLLSLFGLAATPAEARDQRVFLESAQVDVRARTVTLPLLRGVSEGRPVYFVVIDASTSEAADRYGANRANKLANARGTRAVQKVRVVDGVVHFPATVDFAPERVVEPGPQGAEFPPARFEPGAIAEPGYSPLIELPDGTILNAPHLANATGQADKVVTLNTIAGRVVYQLTEGFTNDSRVLYVSTDASDPLAAALENVTLAPRLNFAPGLGNDGSDSARSSLGATINGQTGANNRQRQGFTSALADGVDPRNALAWTPNQGRYSPLWDVHLALWTDAAVARGANVALRDFDDFEKAAEDGLLTGPDGGRFGASNIVVNCPTIIELD